jgi:peptidoglycan/LPS O-acetylase OafA/YrhL
MSTTLTNSVSDKINAEGSSATARALRFESIDGLRGLACLIVLAFHSQLAFGQSTECTFHLGSLQLTPLYILGYGYGGVDIFFVLSGFCLAYPIVSRPNRPVDWKQYALNRARRILPPYWAALATFAVFSLLILHFHIRPLLSGHILAWQGTRQFVYSILLISSNLNGSFWTLPVEWRWYFVLPLLLLLWKFTHGKGLLLCTALISLAWIGVFQPSHWEKMKFIVTVLPQYLFHFGLGIWAAAIVADKGTSKWGQRMVQIAPWGIVVFLFLILLAAPVGLNLKNSFQVLTRPFAWAPLAFFLVLAVTHNSFLKRLFSWRPLVSIGIFSYSLYLIHEPFLRIGAALILPHHWPMFWNLACQIIILPALLIGLAYLFFLVAEKPFLRRPVKKAIEQEVAPVVA